MLSFEQVNALGDALNSTWGVASTERGSFPLGTAPQYSIKGHIVGDTQPKDEKSDLKMVLNYTTIVTYGPDVEMLAQQRKFESISKKLLDDRLSQIKASYRSATGKSLKSKLLESNSSTEIIYTGSTPLSVYTQRHKQDWKRAYFRHVVVYQVS